MDKVGCDLICKSHSARSDRDQYRICPTKLSKPELEHLYFALLENNLELKKTVNGQQDRIKMLSTKMQRMTSAQKTLRTEEKKECCMATKAVVNQQKEMITDLKRSNERMADRIRKLNMRLCSAKQFCKSATPRCLRCSSATSPYLIKHSPSSYKQHSQSTLKFAVSCQNLSRDAMITKCVQTESCDTTKTKENKPCDDNKCRTLLDELKQKITNLQEELTRTHNESSSRVTNLEAELREVRDDNVRVRSERVAAEHDLSQKENRIAQLVTSLRAAEGLATELKTQLSIEKRKVAELETRLKAATMSNRVTQTIETTLTSIQESNKSAATDVTMTCACSPRCHSELSVQQPSMGLYTKDSDETKLSKSTDDSGYMEANKSQNLLDDQSLNKIIEELTNRIVVLQTQVDALTISPPEVETLESKAIMRKDHSTTTEDLSNILTKIDSFQPVPKINVESPSNTCIQKPKSKPEEQFQVIVETKPIVEIKNVSSAKNGHDDDRTPSPVHDPAQSTSWKAGAAKLSIVAKIINEKGDKTKANIDNNNENIGNSVEKSKVMDNKNEKDEKLEDKSVSIEEKTYNVPQNIKNIPAENISEKDENNDVVIKTTAKDKSDKKKDRNVDKKYNIVRKDSYKPSIKEKVTNQQNIDSPKRSLTETVDLKQNEKEFVTNKVKMHKSVEQKTPLARKKTLVRAQTEIHTESTCEEATYTVDKSTDDTSPDNTDFEISSMTDLPEEREPKSPTRKRLLSPGEQKLPSTQTNSIASPSTNYSLSEGEIPTGVRRKPNENKTIPEPGSTIAVPKMEDTLQAITNELALCKRLLFSHRSYDSAVSTSMRNDNKSPSKSPSVHRWASTS